MIGGLLGPLVLLAILPVPASAYPRPGITERVSVASDGTEADGPSNGVDVSISADGRMVAFDSWATNLVTGDTNGEGDIFVHDRVTGITERVSVASDGAESNGLSVHPFLSADGRSVGFHSSGSNLVAGDTNGKWDTFVHDRASGITERVSVSSDGTQSNGTSYKATISSDGRFVSFDSSGSNLVAGDTNGVWDVFVRDRAASVTHRVSVASDGSQASGGQSVISADGRFVAFESGDPNLEGAVLTTDIFVHDRETGVTELVSKASDGNQGNGPSNVPSISADGRYVAFESFASNLVPSDSNTASDVFVHDRVGGVTERISVASDGAQHGEHYLFGAVGDATYQQLDYNASISADGRFVAFSTTTDALRVAVRDRATGATEIVATADGPSVISADGRYVAFQSLASNLVPGDTNGQVDIFVQDRGPSTGVGGLDVGEQLDVSGWATFSGHTVSSAADPAGDAHPGSGPAGGDLVDVELINRPESEDMLVRLRLKELPGRSVGRCIGQPGCPGVNPGAGAPGVLYGVEVTAGGVPYEIRGQRLSTTPWIEPAFSLYRCSGACAVVGSLSGSIGSTGERVEIAVPLEALGADEGTMLEDLRAFTATGEMTTGPVVWLDEVDLLDASIPLAEVMLGMATAGTEESEVSFMTPAPMQAGTFSAVLDGSDLEPGSYDVWARACLAECGATSARVTLSATGEFESQ